MELQKLRYFYKVACLEHVTKAAEDLNIAQPALTQAIKSLEEELRVPLLVKRGRNIALTEYGVYLKNKLEVILPQIDALAPELALLKGAQEKTVKLNILAASTFVINAIVSFRKLYPEVAFDFEQNAKNCDCDILITTGDVARQTGSRVLKRHVKEEKIYLAVPKNVPYAKLQSIDLRQVKEEGFVMFSSARLFGGICNQFCSIAGFSPKILFESDSPTAVQNIISTGTGIAFWPEYSWDTLDNQNVVLLPICYPECKRELIIELYERRIKGGYAEKFYEHLLSLL